MLLCVTLRQSTLFKLTLLWWVEARLQAVEELIKAQLPVCVLIRELNEGIDTQAPGEARTNMHANAEELRADGEKKRTD